VDAVTLNGLFDELTKMASPRWARHLRGRLDSPDVEGTHAMAKRIADSGLLPRNLRSAGYGQESKPHVMAGHLPHQKEQPGLFVAKFMHPRIGQSSYEHQLKSKATIPRLLGEDAAKSYGVHRQHGGEGAVELQEYLPGKASKSQIDALHKKHHKKRVPGTRFHIADVGEHEGNVRTDRHGRPKILDALVDGEHSGARSSTNLRGTWRERDSLARRGGAGALRDFRAGTSRPVEPFRRKGIAVDAGRRVLDFARKHPLAATGAIAAPVLAGAAYLRHKKKSQKSHRVG
jgi:hypothetical protein